MQLFQLQISLVKQKASDVQDWSVDIEMHKWKKNPDETPEVKNTDVKVIQQPEVSQNLPTVLFVKVLKSHLNAKQAAENRTKFVFFSLF